MGNPLRDMENIFDAYNCILESTRTMTDPNMSAPAKHTYSVPLPGSSEKPINGGYTASTLAPVESEEEPKKGNISKQRLSEYVSEEIHKASMYGMDYAVMVLSELQKKFHL